MRVLLIGGSGFIGPHAAHALERQGHDVIVFHRGTTPAGHQVIGDRDKIPVEREILGHPELPGTSRMSPRRSRWPRSTRARLAESITSAKPRA